MENKKILGMILLETGTPNLPGNLTDAKSFAYPVLFEYAKGATTEKIVDGSPEVESIFIKIAKKLESRGVSAITTNCGYAIKYQKDIQNSVSVPVKSSSLFLLPELVKKTASPKGKVGVLVYDANKITPEIIRDSGVAENKLSIRGIENTKSWKELKEKIPKITYKELLKDVSESLRKLLEDGSIEIVLLECSVFPIVSKKLRKDFPIPMYDYMNLCNGLMKK